MELASPAKAAPSVTAVLTGDTAVLRQHTAVMVVNPASEVVVVDLDFFVRINGYRDCELISD